MDRTLDPHTKTVHLIDKRLGGIPFLKCACRQEVGLLWTKEPKDSIPNCLICYGLVQKQNKPL